MALVERNLGAVSDREARKPVSARALAELAADAHLHEGIG